MFDFIVKPVGGEQFEVTADSRDVATWERSGKGRSLASLNRDLRMTDLYALAYTAARRQGKTSGDVAEFEAGNVIDFLEEEAPDPTPSDR